MTRASRLAPLASLQSLVFLGLILGAVLGGTAPYGARPLEGRVTNDQKLRTCDSADRPIKRAGPIGAALLKTRAGPIGAALPKKRAGPIGAALPKKRAGPIGCRSSQNSAAFAKTAGGVLQPLPTPQDIRPRALTRPIPKFSVPACLKLTETLVFTL